MIRGRTKDFFKKLEKLSKSSNSLSSDISLTPAECRDRTIADALEHAYESYKDVTKQNRFFKTIFFWSVIIILFTLMILIVSVSIYYAKKGLAIEHLAIIIAPFATLITSIIVLPRIIAEYLFHKEEPSQYVNILKTIIEKDKQ